MPSDPPVTRGRSAERAAKVAPTPANEMDVLAERLADNQEETKKAMTRMTETVTEKVELLVLAQTQTTNSLSSLDETLRSLVQAMQAQAPPWSPTTASPASSIQSDTTSYKTAIPPPTRFAANPVINGGPSREPDSQIGESEALRDENQDANPTAAAVVRQVEELQGQLINIKENAKRVQVPSQLLMPAPPRLQAYLDRIDNPLHVFAHFTRVEEYRNQYANYNMELVFQNSISVALLQDHMKLGTDKFDGRTSLGTIPQEDIMEAIHRALAWKIPTVEIFINIMDSFPFSPRRAVSADAVGGPEDVIYVQAWLRKLNRLYRFLVKIVMAGKFVDSIPKESEYHRQEPTTMKWLIRGKLGAHLPWFKTPWNKLYSMKSNNWLDLHAVLERGLDEVKAIMEMSYAINLSCASARLKNEQFARERDKRDEARREQERANRIPLLQRDSSHPQGFRLERRDRVQSLNQALATHETSEISSSDHASPMMTTDSDGDGDLGAENAEDVLTDSMASAASQDQLQHLQNIAARDKTQEKKGWTRSVLACHHTFANGTPCPHEGCRYDHSREAMIAKAKSLGYINTMQPSPGQAGGATSSINQIPHGSSHPDVKEEMHVKTA